MIIALYGEGKGKTTSAIGTILRSLNLGKNVVIIQLYKNKKNTKSNEIDFLEKFELNNLAVFQFGKEKGWVNLKKPDAIDRKMTQKAVEKIFSLLKTKAIDVMLVDELLLAHYYGLCSDEVVENIIKQAHVSRTDLIITGRKMKTSLLPHLDLVSEITNIKHPFDKKQLAKQGIDY